MAIVCDYCREEVVNKNGEICESCIDKQKFPEADKRCGISNNIYLEPVLFEKYNKLVKDIEGEKKNSKKALGKFMNVLKTSFIDKFTGKEINDPTPQVIVAKHTTNDRIEKILQHNLAVYAAQNDMDTPEDLEDFTVDDIYSDDFENSIYQYVDNIELMEEETPVKPTSQEQSEGELAPASSTPSGSAPGEDLGAPEGRPESSQNE